MSLASRCLKSTPYRGFRHQLSFTYPSAACRLGQVEFKATHLRFYSGFLQIQHQSLQPAGLRSRFILPVWINTNTGARMMSASKKVTLNLNDEACPQGIQGDDCETFKIWLENCQRYGLASCNDQLQGIQSGRKTIAEVMAEQEKEIEEVTKRYKAAATHEHSGSAQGLQGYMSAFPPVDSPCPQGVQGLDCARYKMWLENCHQLGVADCMEQYQHFKEGRKTLSEIFAEQDKIIREAATPAYQKLRMQSRHYSTSSKQPNETSSSSPSSSEEPTLSQRQKLQRAVKEYGSTVIVFHVTISLMSLGFFYMLVSSGIDVVGLLMKLNIANAFLENKLAAGTSTFVVAYAVHKVFAPARIATTLTATPFIVRYLRRIGFLKVPAPAKPKQ